LQSFILSDVFEGLKGLRRIERVQKTSPKEKFFCPCRTHGGGATVLDPELHTRLRASCALRIIGRSLTFKLKFADRDDWKIYADLRIQLPEVPRARRGDAEDYG
jgi:hypothetical protein